MKIEMGESIVYSWLRHVKGCQIVQNNWKVSPYWQTTKESELQTIIDTVNSEFSGKYDIFKKNKGVSQILLQGEADAIGYSMNDKSLYGVDIAFHRGGLNYYGGKISTIGKILEKCVRTAMCFYGFFETKEAEIIFASPKIGKAIYSDAIIAVKKLQLTMDTLGYRFRFRLIANSDFREEIIDPVMISSSKVDDTAELFLRSYQLLEMFYSTEIATGSSIVGTSSAISSKAYGEYKIGQLANVVLADMLEREKATPSEVAQMLTSKYSKDTFGLQYPLLVETETPYDSTRYYVKELCIYGKKYHLCSQWFETESNNDRPYLETWIKAHL